MVDGLRGMVGDHHEYVFILTVRGGKREEGGRGENYKTRKFENSKLEKLECGGLCHLSNCLRA
jgi:hypothetical protein